MNIRNRCHRTRRGVTLAECGVVYSVALLLIFGTIILGMGVYRAELVAQLAREGARWASVHGATYQQENGTSAPTNTDVYNNVILGMAVGLDASKLTCTLTMTATKATVTVQYDWTPEGLFRPITLSSTSVMPISY